MIRDLNRLYRKYNKKIYIHPDPLEMVYRYDRKEDQEIVGLIASSFAVGNVKAILKFLDSLLMKMGDSPYLYLKNTDSEKIEADMENYYYRYYSSDDIAQFLLAVKSVLVRFGSIEEWVMCSYNSEDENISVLMRILSADLNLNSSLIPKSTGNSGFKRFALYFRWMVRKDDVDLGLWKGISPSKLILPLDTHMMNISHILGFTNSKANSMSNALKITNEFKRIESDDPVKWDFALSRLGIHPDLSYDELISLF